MLVWWVTVGLVLLSVGCVFGSFLGFALCGCCGIHSWWISDGFWVVWVVVGLGALGLRFLVLCLYGGFSCGWPMVWVCFFLGLGLVVFCSVALAWCVWSVLGVLGDFLGFWFYVGCCGGHFLVGLLVA